MVSASFSVASSGGGGGGGGGSGNPPATDHPPGAPIILGPTTGVDGTQYSFTASSTDPDGDQVKFIFDMNNTGTFGATTSPVASGSSVPFSDTWTSVGTKTFSVAAIDPSGSSATSTYTINISASTTPSTPPTSSTTTPPSSIVHFYGGGGGGGSHFYSNSVSSPSTTTTSTTTTVTTVANAQANTPVSPVVGLSVCKAGDYITAYMRQGIDNDPAEVRKLQTFLNEYDGANLNVNGTFDASTTEAVKDFQVKYSKDVLSPWGIDYPTGIVYITTAHEINNMFCSLNPGYVGGPSATTTPQFNGAIGFNTAKTGTSTLNLGTNIAGVIGAVNQNLKDFLKDILWYPLLILLLMGTGIWLILRFIFLKDKNDKGKQGFFINGTAAFLVACVLNAANTLFYLIAPATFLKMTYMTDGTVLSLDLINIVCILAAALSTLHILQGYLSRRFVSAV